MTVHVSFDYPVVFTRDALAEHDDTLLHVLARKEPDRRHRAVVVVDEGLVRARPSYVAEIETWFRRRRARLELVVPPRLVVGGEASKNDPALVQSLLELLHDQKIDRHSYVVGIGGGAVLDLVGYAAAVAHRGVRHVRMPSTVLAQADSGVGVKNGVNAFGKKNFLGTFAPPFGVVCDTELLETLAPRDKIAGMAEAVKVALVRDATFHDWIVRRAADLASGDAVARAELVERSAMLHLSHIQTSGDPFELGSARPLDFGHWAAHKLESMTRYRLRHGEAVAIGIAVDILYSAEIGLCERALADEVLALLRTLGFTLWDEALDATDEDGRLLVLDGLGEFREHLGGELTVTMIERAGASRELHVVDEAVVTRCVEELHRRVRRARVPSSRVAEVPA